RAARRRKLRRLRQRMAAAGVAVMLGAWGLVYTQGQGIDTTTTASTGPVSSGTSASAGTSSPGSATSSAAKTPAATSVTTKAS
ncbi:MAG: hypothetical protein JWO02_2362, partial [Solirubrobacterales bacterium]|nr:hypothetical protein [Solirubrobacterales bacterium]